MPRPRSISLALTRLGITMEQSNWTRKSDWIPWHVIRNNFLETLWRARFFRPVRYLSHPKRFEESYDHEHHSKSDRLVRGFCPAVLCCDNQYGSDARTIWLDRLRARHGVWKHGSDNHVCSGRADGCLLNPTGHWLDRLRPESGVDCLQSWSFLEVHRSQRGPCPDCHDTDAGADRSRVRIPRTDHRLLSGVWLRPIGPAVQALVARQSLNQITEH